MSREPLRLILVYILLIVVCSLSATKTHAEDDHAFWPEFHGPKRDNISTDTGLLKKWPEEGPKLLWTAKDLGFGYSTVSLAEGMVFTAGDIKDDTVITALDMKGKTLWRAKNGESWLGSYPGSRGTPTLDGNFLYHENPHGAVTCMEIKSGKMIWTVNILEKFESTNLTWALSESVLIDGDRVICCPGGPQTSMVALDKRTGKVAWKAESTNEFAGYASPILVEIEGLRIIITMTSKALIGVNADTGKLLWHVKHLTYADENIITPVYFDGHIFISTVVTGSVKWKIRVEDGKASLEEVWRSKEMDNHHGGVVLVDGYLYGASCISNREAWVCLDWKTGEVKYVDRGVGKGSLTFADGLLYILSRNATLGLVKPTPKEHAIISAFKLPRQGKDSAWAHPVVCGGRLYVRYGEALYAYDVKVRGPE